MLAKLFSVNQQSLDYKKEIIGGLINFMAIAYIIAVNPLILHANGAGFPLNAAITSTVIIIIIMTMLAGFVIKLPFVLAPGMGINAIVAYTLVLHDKLPIQTVLGVILFSSILLFIFSVTKIRQIIILSIPYTLQVSLSAGIGLFLFLIGAKNINLIVANPNTIIGINHLSLDIIISLLGFLVAVVLFIKQKSYALLLPIVLISIINALIHPDVLPQVFFQAPDFSLFFQVDYLAALKLSLLPTILLLFLVNFFDATSTSLGLLSQLKFNSAQEKEFYLRRALITDGGAGILSSVVGTSPSVIFVESSAAIQNGATTGLASVVTALLCIPFVFMAPLISAIPSIATAPILMLVGLLMFSHIRKVEFEKFEEMVASFLTIIMMPLCFSITAGAVFGVVSYTLLKILLGKKNELSISLVIIAILCCGWFFIE